MKAPFIATAILFGIILFCLFTANYTSDFCLELEGVIVMCIECVNENDWDGAALSIANAQTKFDKKNHFLEMFMMHQDLSDIYDNILRIKSGVNLRNKEVCLSESAVLIEELKNLAVSDALTVKNIF